MLNLLPWHGQLIVPPETSSTSQPRWVQAISNALNSPAAGWVTTTFCSLKTLPPPSGMSAVVANPVDAPLRSSPPDPSPGPEEVAPMTGSSPAAAFWDRCSDPPQAPSTATRPTPPAPSMTARRVASDVEG